MAGGHARSRRPKAAPTGAPLRALRAASHSSALPAMPRRRDRRAGSLQPPLEWIGRAASNVVVVRSITDWMAGFHGCALIEAAVVNSPSGRVGFSDRFSVPGVRKRLKGRRGPTIFLRPKIGPKKIVTPIAAPRSRLCAIP